MAKRMAKKPAPLRRRLEPAPVAGLLEIAEQQGQRYRPRGGLDGAIHESKIAGQLRSMSTPVDHDRPLP